MMRECLNDKKAISTLNKCLEVYGGGAGRMGTCMWITILKMERGNPKEMEGFKGGYHHSHIFAVRRIIFHQPSIGASLVTQQ